MIALGAFIMTIVSVLPAPVRDALVACYHNFMDFTNTADFVTFWTSVEKFVNGLLPW